MDKPQDPEAADTVQTKNVPAVDMPRFVVPLCSYRDAGNVTITEAMRWSIMECDDPDITSEVQRIGGKLKLLISGHNKQL